VLGQQAATPDTQAALPRFVHKQPSSAFAAVPDITQPPNTTAADNTINFLIAQSSVREKLNYEFHYRRRIAAYLGCRSCEPKDLG
jgi:hypothetical protein